MSKTCNACGGAVCEVCGGCIAHGECSCMEDQIQKYIDRAEVAEARLSITEKNAAKILAERDELRANHDQIEADYLRLYAAHKALRAELAAVRQMWKETIDRRIRQALKNG